MNTTVDGDRGQPESSTQPAENAPDSAAPEEPEQGAAGISDFRTEIDHIDAEILRLVKRRAEVSRQVGEQRMAAGGPRIVYNREMDVLARYRELGPEGRELAMILLRLGRGRLGHEGAE